MRIIDTRFRPGTPDTFRGILSNPLYKSFSETTNFAARPTASLDEEVAMLRGLGVTRAVVTGRDIASTEFFHRSVRRGPSSADEVAARSARGNRKRGARHFR